MEEGAGHVCGMEESEIGILTDITAQGNQCKLGTNFKQAASFVVRIKCGLMLPHLLNLTGL